MAVNKELLQKVFNHIANHVEKHEQRLWFETGIETLRSAAEAGDIRTENFDESRFVVSATADKNLVNVLTEDCGTVGCFAGWSCLLSGASPLIYEDALAITFDDDEESSRFDKESSRFELHEFVSSSGLVASPDVMARRLLGLKDDEARRLFHADNTIEQLRALCLVLLNTGEMTDDSYRMVMSEYDDDYDDEFRDGIATSFGCTRVVSDAEPITKNSEGVYI